MMRERLIDRLYQGFDQDPKREVAFWLAGPGGVSWAIAGQILQIKTLAGAILVTVDLSMVTVGGIADQLALAGCSVIRMHSAASGLTGLVLLDGSDSLSAGGESPIYFHRSILWAIFTGYAQELAYAQASVPAAIEQAYLHSAGGDWLDFWGGYLGVSRGYEQPDASYLTAIISEVIRPRSNGRAIENAVMGITGSRIKIDEPWRRVFRVSQSKLSSGHQIKDGSRVGRCLIRPIAFDDVYWSEILPVVDRSRAAGVLRLKEQVVFGGVVAATLVAKSGIGSCTGQYFKWPSRSWTNESWRSVDESWGGSRLVVVTSSHDQIF